LWCCKWSFRYQSGRMSCWRSWSRTQLVRRLCCTSSSKSWVRMSSVRMSWSRSSGRKWRGRRWSSWWGGRARGRACRGSTRCGSAGGDAIRRVSRCGDGGEGDGDDEGADNKTLVHCLGFECVDLEREKVVV